MRGQGAKNLSGDDIKLVLSSADQIARSHGDDLVETYEEWLPDLEFLASEQCPKTYLPVLAVMLVARSLRGKEELDVFAIQQKTSDRGYAASSIARELIPFATQVGVDFRTTSTQVMNNQPFTFEERVVPGMAGDRAKRAFAKFYAAAERVQEANSGAAGELLSLIFFLRRVKAEPASEIFVIDGGRNVLLAATEVIADFVRENSEGGKVGQAFVAAVLDLLFPQATVRMGKVNDPSASVPGDVHVGNRQRLWLWSEVKQRPVVTTDVQTFLKSVQSNGGDRAWYFALANQRYTQNLNVVQLFKFAANNTMELVMYQDPQEVLEDVIPKLAGTADDLTAQLMSRFARRLDESGVSIALRDDWYEITESALP